MTMTWPIRPVRLGPIWSTMTPAISRRMAPESTGTATISPFWPASRCRVLEIATPNGPRITQTMKLRSK